MPRRAKSNLAADLAALRLNGVTSASFHPDGRLATVEMGPPVMPFTGDEPEDTRGVMVLPGNPRGGPAEAPVQRAAKPKDIFRDVLLADMPDAGPLTAEDLPEEPDDGDDEPEPAEAEGEAPDGTSETGLPHLGPGQDS